MSNIKFVVAVGAVAAWVGLFACGGSTVGGGNTTVEANACLATVVGSDCFSCVQASCGPELSDYESACSDYLSCVCPGGNFSCSLATSSACNPNAGGSSCATAEASYGACGLQNCKAQCSSGGAPCERGAVTNCTGSASFDAGTCTNRQLLESCSVTAGGMTSCYYKVGSQQFECSSCTDTTSCAEAANAACH
jgi:hypothetical protein